MVFRSDRALSVAPLSTRPFRFGKDALRTKRVLCGRDRAVSGFTLIELMIVVAIIALVTAATMPSFSTALRQNRQREVGALIVEAVFNARSRAARSGRCHRVRVYYNTKPGVSNGTGGTVDVYASDQFNCSQTTLPATVWTRISIKSVAGRPDPDPAFSANGPLAGVVGKDVAITTAWGANDSVLINPGDIDTMLFEPTGGLFNLLQRSYQIEMYLSDGSPMAGDANIKYVNVLSGGSVQYGNTRRK